MTEGDVMSTLKDHIYLEGINHRLIYGQCMANVLTDQHNEEFKISPMKFDPYFFINKSKLS